MTVIEVLLKVLPILAAITLGYFLYQRSIIKDSHIDGFKKIVVNVTLPASLLLAFATTSFKLKYIIVIAAVFITCLLMFLLAKVVARLLKIKSPYFPFLMAGFEAGMMGYALYSGIYGSERLSEFIIIDIGQVLFVFIIAVPLIVGIGRERKGGFFEQSFKTAVKSPIIWAILIGLVLSVSGIGKFATSNIYITIADILDFISKPTQVLISIVIGSGLKFSLSKMKKETLTAAAKVFLTIIFSVVIIFIVLRPLELSFLQPALLTMFVLPGPFVIPVFMDTSDRGEVQYVSNTLSIGTLLALVCVVIVALI